MTLPIGFSFLSQAGPVSIQGTERDWECDYERWIRYTNPKGGWPRGRAYFEDATPQKHDVVYFRFTLWCDGANAALIESSLPPYNGTRAAVDLCWVTGNAANPIVPGFGNYTVSDGWKIVKCTLEPVEALSQKGPRIDLWGYRVKGSFAACGNGTALNERNLTVPTDTTAPAFFAQKFSSHQVQDASTTPRPLPVAGANLPLVQHGRRRDARMMLDHMTFAEAEAAINWFRAVRMNKFVVPGATDQYVSPFGPGRFGGELAVATKLTIRRGSGWWYEGELDITSTMPE